MDVLLDPQTWLALLTLTALEIVLGIDNIIFISILANKLPDDQRDNARRVGILAAMAMRIALLLGINWVVSLTAPLVEVLGREFSGRDLILIVGGLFLIGKATLGDPRPHGGRRPRPRDPRSHVLLGRSIAQIMLLDIIFSLDSVITAVGMANDISVMIAAVVIAVLVMLVASGYVTRLIDRHPTLKMLALAFLLLIGVTLVADGLGTHIDKGYIYFAMGFAVFVEALNIRWSSRNSKPLKMHDPYHEIDETSGREHARDGGAAGPGLSLCAGGSAWTGPMCGPSRRSTAAHPSAPRKDHMLTLGYKASAEQFGPPPSSRLRHRRGAPASTPSGRATTTSPGGTRTAMPPTRSCGSARPPRPRERVVLGTSVLTPSFRYNPAIVAQAFATLGCLAPERVVLGVGTGESLNEVVVGVEWPEQSERFARLKESVDLIQTLFRGEFVSFEGQYYKTHNATIYDNRRRRSRSTSRPPVRPPRGSPDASRTASSAPRARARSCTRTRSCRPSRRAPRRPAATRRPGHDDRDEGLLRHRSGPGDGGHQDLGRARAAR